MKPKCIQQVTAAANGRPISPAKLQAIDDAISGKMRELARRDPQGWQAMSRDQRMAQAADAAMKDIQAQAQLKEYRAGLQVLRAAESDERIRTAMALNDLTRSQGLIRDIELTETCLLYTSDAADDTR